MTPTTDTTTEDLDQPTPATEPPVEGPAAASTDAAQNPATAGEAPDEEPAAAPPAAPRPAPAVPRTKPVTWETERNAAVAALLRVGGTEREARVLASEAANAGSVLRREAEKGRGDPATANDRAAAEVLAVYRAGIAPYS
jgi:hypothetical protein